MMTKENKMMIIEEAVMNYEKEITEVVALGANSRKRALLWMLDTKDVGLPECEYDVDNWMANRGLLGEDKIKKELIAAMKNIWNDAKWINA
jgi:hypothetical protein|tara:strand:- start:1162 stop:1434 length:273 start_codon:yes stop_codon:yes gene_type:complete